MPASAPITAAAVNDAVTGQSMPPAGEMGDECRRARQGNYGQGGADRLGEADAEQNREGGDDQEASADAVEAG